MSRKKLSDMTPIERVEQRMKGMSWEEAEDVGVEILARCLALHMYVRKDEEKYIDHLLTRILERGTEWAKENALGLAMASVGLKTMKILELPLNKEWYNMIESGEKREEYREIKPYWQNRLALDDNRNQLIGLNPRGYTHVRFRYGYTKRTMLYKIDEIIIGRGNPSWGAPTDKDVFIIKFH